MASLVGMVTPCIIKSNITENEKSRQEQVAELHQKDCCQNNICNLRTYTYVTYIFYVFLKKQCKSKILALFGNYGSRKLYFDI